jgi:hypothetical protein
MRRKYGVILDAKQEYSEIIATALRRDGWTVLETEQEAEVGYQLLMWYDPSELPDLVVINVHDAREILDFCAILKEEEVLRLLPVIVLLNESDWNAAGEFERLDVNPLAKSGDLLPRIKELVERADVHSTLRRSDVLESLPGNHTGGSTRTKRQRSRGSSSMRFW